MSMMTEKAKVKGIAVIQPGCNEGMDHFFKVFVGHKGFEVGYNPQLLKKKKKQQSLSVCLDRVEIWGEVSLLVGHSAFGFERPKNDDFGLIAV